jgi:hypothetical protein
LSKALRPRAPLLLQKLQTAHPAFKPDKTTKIPNAFMGIEMWGALEVSRDIDVSEYDEKRYQSAYEKMRDSPLHDNCSPSEFSKRVNTFTSHVNPYLEVKLEGERLAKFILISLPDSIRSDVRALKRELVANSKIDDVPHVVAAAQELVEACYIPTKKRVDAKPVMAATAESSNGLSADSVKKLILAAMKAQGTVSKSKGEKKAVLAAAVAAAKDLKKKTGGTRLPDGVRCKRGTCTFNHDETAPDSPCYRDPEWEGPLPKRIREDKEQLGRVIKDREENAKRLGKTCKRLLEGDATSANLVDMLDELETGVFMLDTEQLFEELDDSQLDDGRTVTPGERRGSMDVMDIASELLSADSGAMTQPTLFDTPGGRATDAIVLCDVGSGPRCRKSSQSKAPNRSKLQPISSSLATGTTSPLCRTPVRLAQDRHRHQYRSLAPWHSVPLQTVSSRLLQVLTCSHSQLPLRCRKRGCRSPKQGGFKSRPVRPSPS